MSKLKGKIAFVTGASKGIGAGIARCLGAEGARVIIGYSSDASGAERTLAGICEAGGEGSILLGDFSNPEAITLAFREISQTHGRLDVLVNNAGVAGFGALDQVTASEFQRIFSLNVLGVMLATQAAARLMKDGGSVINIGSMAGQMPGPYSSIYSASKAAVDNLTISLSKELGAKQIRVNSVNPALTLTGGARSFRFYEG